MADSAIKEIEGIGETYAPKFQALGIKTVADLLERGKTPSGRKKLAEATGISEKLILKWVNFSDLFRVKGIGPEYSELLEKAGVDTVKELRNRVPENLHTKLEAANTSTGRPLVRALPGLKAVQSWIQASKQTRRLSAPTCKILPAVSAWSRKPWPTLKASWELSDRAD